MRARFRLLALISLIGAAAVMSAAAPGAPAHWGAAIEVPGTAALNLGGSAAVTTVSCPSPGNCTAGGYYNNRWIDVEYYGIETDKEEKYGKAFVVNETNGVWGAAVTLPTRGPTSLNSISCRTVGSCAAGGSYTDLHGHRQAWVANERNGIWAKPIKVPGTTRLSDRDTFLYTISCPEAGFCAAGGAYDEGSSEHAFVVNERNGVWGKAIGVPKSAGIAAGVYSISCATADSCAAGGMYGSFQAFVMDERHGVWGEPIQVPGSGRLYDKYGGASVTSISCATARFCAVGGTVDINGYTDTVGFVATEENGVWGKAVKIGSYTGGREAQINSISCARAGSCTAGGSHITNHGVDEQALVVTERNGVWGKAITVPGTTRLNVGAIAETYSISCATAGSCAAGGYYVDDPSGDVSTSQAFVANERRGVWRKAMEVPGSGALNVGASGDPYAENGPHAWVSSISCARAGSCVAGGYYTDSSGNTEAFVTGP